MAFRSVFDAVALRNEFENAGISSQFIPIIWKHVRQKPTSELDEIPSLPAAAYPILRSKFKAMTSSLTSAAKSKDGLTTKLLIRLQNGNLVEAVIMRYDPTLGKYDGKRRPGCQRSTLCISSQVGCKMACKFCATGTMGFKNNLSPGEIVEQLVHASRFSDIRNVVFMGMGEPLNNFTAVVEAIQIMMGSPFQLSPKRITVSTVGLELRRWLVVKPLVEKQTVVKVGIIHAINKFHDTLPNVNLAVSLHAPDQDIRCQIMPSARAFPLGRLMEALHAYQEKSQRKIFIEYIMLDGINDLEQHAHQLGKLLQTLEVVVNLIPFNPIGTSSCFRTSSEHNVKVFQKLLRGTYNIRTTIRQQMGEDISGACGQLVVNLSEQISTGSVRLLADIEDLHI
ncbi:23S rRNA (adenine2503-C2)-methyltransferase [Dendrobium catenatum]|uniref:23S rRNA (Adenine2503-C2)-methyltransferase n=1 Tax=Dendrobium catenatum TaxID=906689 RepID=A0A2I0XA08_9ASPA|nr:23S rRNA (adenine2503-C2)-methyltransferase [Dendrobium catenatum]